ncbi:MAG: hypothetical protein IKB43_01815, partial [Fibrobacter sp.]|nr:hypothetical protein [Fibrobacter sp.]
MRCVLKAELSPVSRNSQAQAGYEGENEAIPELHVRKGAERSPVSRNSQAQAGYEGESEAIPELHVHKGA